MITDRIGLHSVLLPLHIKNEWESFIRGSKYRETDESTRLLFRGVWNLWLNTKHEFFRWLLKRHNKKNMQWDIFFPSSSTNEWTIIYAAMQILLTCMINCFGVIVVARTLSKDGGARFREPKTVYEERKLLEKLFPRQLNIKTTGHNNFWLMANF